MAATLRQAQGRQTGPNKVDGWHKETRDSRGVAGARRPKIMVFGSISGGLLPAVDVHGWNDERRPIMSRYAQEFTGRRDRSR